ncbi:unnamed protein product [Sphenostylis stenocarpa]|uniref:ATP-dependent DNA helicase n=1 Tax=Sphenostylis stenocarpa TaxID=92480 RepID=A0AA86VSY0_9FABA|nr:unnamed protein product [Sphenostylis stenocarpa]
MGNPQRPTRRRKALKVFNLVAVGAADRNVTISAGTGKALLLEGIIKFLNRLHVPSRIKVTGFTGVPALPLKGCLLEWGKFEVLVIDDISMMSAKPFDSLQFVASGVRGVDETLGGIQLDVSGDFFQLPPMVSNKDYCSQGVMYAIEAECWNRSLDLEGQLKRVFG